MLETRRTALKRFLLLLAGAAGVGIAGSQGLEAARSKEGSGETMVSCRAVVGTSTLTAS